MHQNGLTRFITIHEQGKADTVLYKAALLQTKGKVVQIVLVSIKIHRIHAAEGSCQVT